MKKTKKLTLSAILVAMSVVFMLLGSFVEIMDLSVCAAASLIIVFIYLEIGPSYALMAYLSTSVIGFIILPAKLMAVEYFLVFGIYPLLKAFVERFAKWSWIPLKLVFINAVIWILFAVCELLLGVPFFEGDNLFLKVCFYLFINLTFIVYDVFITVMVRFYYDKIRHRIRALLR